MEIQSQTKHKSKQIITLQQGALRSVSSHQIAYVDTSTELRLFFALQRRHVAFELVDLLTWEACQLWLDKLMASLVHEPFVAGQSLNLTQILRADREIFTLMASEFSGSLVAEKDKEPPLDSMFRRLMHDPRVNVHLIAMPRPHAPPAIQPKWNEREGDHGGQPKGNPKGTVW